VSYNVAVYIYVPSMGCWMLSRSPVAVRTIADVLGMENVTVNFAASTEPFMTFLERLAPRVIGIIPRLYVYRPGD
jgi:hypothetical protein